MAGLPGPTPLTRSRVSKDKRLLFLPDIVAWMNDEARRKQYVKSRRIGVSYGHAYDRVSRRVRGLRRNALYTGISQEMTREYMEYCAFHTRTFNLAADIIEGQAEAAYRTADGKRRKLIVNTFRIEYPSGAHILAMPSRPAALRGHDGDVDADEWALHEDQAGLYRAAVHCTKWHGAQFAGWSTHNGEATLFRKCEQNYDRVLAALGIAPSEGPPEVALDALVERGRALRLRPLFRVHRTTIVRAVDQGLVDILNRVSGTSYTRETFLAECRDECLNDEHYGQEYMCRPASALLAALKYHVIEACQHEACPSPIEGFERLDEFMAAFVRCYTGGPLFLGMDIGRTRDLTVLWVWEAVGDVLWTRGILRLRNCSLVDQEVAAGRLFAYKLARCSILWRGMGVGVYDHLERKFGTRVAKIDESRPVKVGLVAGIVQAFEDRRVRVPLDDLIKEVLHSVREVRTPGGQVSYDAPESDAGHADDFWAAAAGIDGASMSGGGITSAQVGVLKEAGKLGQQSGALLHDPESELARRRGQKGRDDAFARKGQTCDKLGAGKANW